MGVKKAREVWYAANAAYIKAAEEYKSNPRPTRTDVNAFEEALKRFTAATIARNNALKEANPPAHAIYR